MHAALKRCARYFARVLRGTAPSRPWLATSVPRPVREIPAFLSLEEEQYLIWLTERTFAGWGAIVDLGAFVGGSSACLAEGLRRRRRSERIQSFDLFQWERDSMGPASGLDLPDGADFLHVLERNVRDYRAWIEPRKEDLLAFRWSGGPIEILFIDAAKTWELLNAILAGFGDSIVPGKTRVVFQDFRFYSTYFLPLVVGSRPDLWSEVEAVDDGSTVTFRTRLPLWGPGGIDREYSDECFSLEDSEAILRPRIERESAANRVLLLRTLYRKSLIELPSDRVSAVREELFAAEGGRTDARILATLEDVAWLVSRRAWLAHERGDLSLARRLAENCIAERGTVPQCLHLLGRICLNSGELPLAEDYLTRAIAAGLASCVYAVLDRAELRRRTGRHAEAKRDVLLFLDHSVRNDRATEHALWLLERIWEDEGRSDRGIGAVGKLARTTQGSAALWAHLARIESSLGHRAEALEHIARASSIAPEHPFVAKCRSELAMD